MQNNVKDPRFLAISKHIENSQSIMGLINPITYGARERAKAYNGWIELVGYGKDWDFKTFLNPGAPGAPKTDVCPSPACVGNLTICGGCYRFDVVANIHYGYMGRKAGFTLQELLKGASAAQYKRDGT